VWVERRAKKVLDIMKNDGFQPKYLIRDRDGKYSEKFDEFWGLHGVDVKKTPARNPSCDVYAERWV
jgi:hypothetical protein